MIEIDMDSVRMADVGAAATMKDSQLRAMMMRKNHAQNHRDIDEDSTTYVSSIDGGEEGRVRPAGVPKRKVQRMQSLKMLTTSMRRLSLGGGLGVSSPVEEEDDEAPAEPPSTRRLSVSGVANYAGTSMRRLSMGASPAAKSATSSPPETRRSSMGGARPSLMDARRLSINHQQQQQAETPEAPPKHNMFLSMRRLSMNGLGGNDSNHSTTAAASPPSAPSSSNHNNGPHMFTSMRRLTMTGGSSGNPHSINMFTSMRRLNQHFNSESHQQQHASQLQHQHQAAASKEILDKIRQAVVVQTNREKDIRKRIRVHTDRAKARYATGTAMGAVISMRKVKQLEGEQANVLQAIGFLRMLEADLVDRMEVAEKKSKQQFNRRASLSMGGGGSNGLYSPLSARFQGFQDEVDDILSREPSEEELKRLSDEQILLELANKTTPTAS